MFTRCFYNNPLKKLGVAGTGLVVLMSVATTAGATESEGEFAGSNSRNGAEFTFTIEDENCAVTINSNKRIRRFAFKNDRGRTIKARGVRNQKHLTGFVSELTAHPHGQIAIRSGDGKWTRLNSNINLAFAECIAPEPEPETSVFAVVYTDTNANKVYEPNVDILIAKWSDGGDPGRGDGDIIELGTIPTDFSNDPAATRITPAFQLSDVSFTDLSTATTLSYSFDGSAVADGVFDTFTLDIVKGPVNDGLGLVIGGSIGYIVFDRNPTSGNEDNITVIDAENQIVLQSQDMGSADSFLEIEIY